MAQDKEYNLGHREVFGHLRRPQVGFLHENNVETLEDTACGVCYHTPGDTAGRVAYIEGDERSYLECHSYQKEYRISALREAFHGSCTSCHRNQIKSGNLKSGPTACGGCHRKN